MNSELDKAVMRLNGLFNKNIKTSLNNKESFTAKYSKCPTCSKYYTEEGLKYYHKHKETK